MKLTGCLLLVGALISGCPGQDDPAVDATDASSPRADSEPSADTKPAEDAGPVTPTSGPRTYQITAAHTDDLVGGDLADARIGDWVIRNDHVRFVIRGGNAGLYTSGTGGGGIIDVGEPADDRVEEIIPIVSFGTFSGEAVFTILANGADGYAELQVRTKAEVPPLISAWLPILTVDGEIIQTYRVQRGGTALEITTTVAGVLATQDQLMGDFLFLGGELLPQVRDVDGWLAAEGPNISIGLVGEAPFTVADLGGLTAIMGPEAAAPATFTRWLVVGDGSMSSVVDQMIVQRMTPHGSLHGTVSPPGVDVVVRDGNGEVVTRFRTGTDGSFSGLVPVGLVTVRTEGPARQPGAPEELDVIDGDDIELALVAAPAGTLEVTVEIPLRLDVNGPGFHRLVPLAPGTTLVPLPPGEYTLTATRGYEYELDQTSITLEPNGSAAWSPTLVRSVDTAGWIAADFHLHSEWSVDSNVPLRQRILLCAAEGIEYAVSTDHDVVTDYAPFVVPALQDWIVVGQGIEVSTTMGHINVWPMVADPSKQGRGNFAWYNLELDPLMELLNAAEPGRVVQINHGRSSSSGIFASSDFDPVQPQADLLSSYTFNAMELFNGGGGGFDELLIDWIALREAGLEIAATGVSDSHNPGAWCGHARTMVEVDGETPGIDVFAINDRVRAQATLVTTGPFVTLEAGSGGAVHLRIQAPSFMPVDRVKLFADGVLDTELDIEATTDVLRFDDDIALSNPTAKRVIAVVFADSTPSPMLKRPIRAVTPVLNR